MLLHSNKKIVRSRASSKKLENSKTVNKVVKSIKSSYRMKYCVLEKTSYRSVFYHIVGIRLSLCKFVSENVCICSIRIDIGCTIVIDQPTCNETNDVTVDFQTAKMPLNNSLNRNEKH